jgi:hypothetical protein
LFCSLIIGSYNKGLIINNYDSVSTSNFTFSQCIFDSLTSYSRFGGVIYLSPGIDSWCIISECIFTNQLNRNSTVYGGYVHIARKPSSLKVDCFFYFFYFYRLIIVHLHLQMLQMVARFI